MKNITILGTHSFRVRLMVKGKSENKVFDTLREARIFRDNHLLAKAKDSNLYEAEIIQHRLKKNEVKITLGQALEKYLREITPTKKGAKVESYRIKKALRTKLMQKTITAVLRVDIREFLAEIGTSENSQRKYVSIISDLYNKINKKESWNEWTGYTSNIPNPIDQIERPSNGTKRERRLEGKEYDLMLKALNGETRSFFIIAVETAMRKSELLGLEWKNINLKESTALLLDTKNSEKRNVSLSPTALKCLKEIKLKSKSENVFTITESELRIIWVVKRAAIGSPDLRIHDLRHEAISRLFEKGELNMMEIAATSGHKTMDMLKRYTHLSPNKIAKKMT